MPREPIPVSMRSRLVEESTAMLAHALAEGRPVPEAAAPLIGRLETAGDAVEAELSTEELLRLHALLAGAIAPAKPQAIVSLAQEKARRGLLTFLGPVPVARRLTVLAVLSLLIAIAASLSPYVEEGSGDLLRMSGLPLLMNQIFFLSAAALGASFSGLMRVNRFISAGTFDPSLESSYWIRFVLGLVGGTILAQLLHVESADSIEHTIGRPTLAMLGGYSSSLVYRILDRVMQLAEGLIRDDAGNLAEAQSQLAAAQAEHALGAQRLELARRLFLMRRELGDANPDADAALERLIDELMPAREPVVASPTVER